MSFNAGLKGVHKRIQVCSLLFCLSVPWLCAHCAVRAIMNSLWNFWVFDCRAKLTKVVKDCAVLYPSMVLDSCVNHLGVALQSKNLTDMELANVILEAGPSIASSLPHFPVHEHLFLVERISVLPLLLLVKLFFCLVAMTSFPEDWLAASSNSMMPLVRALVDLPPSLDPIYASLVSHHQVV